jgi:hypothetical protein
MVFGARRTSSVRWLTISTLLMALERSVETNARLDAYSPSDEVPQTNQAAARFDRRLRIIETRIDHELDRLTVERLTLDLATKKARVAA